MSEEIKMSEMTETEVFVKWHSERMGHPIGVHLGINAVKEQQETITNQAERIEELEDLAVMVVNLSKVTYMPISISSKAKQLLQKDGE